MKDEEYRSLDFMGYPDYEVSNLGNVRSLNYRCTGKEKVLKKQKNKRGYLYLDLYKNKNKKHFLVHRLVAFAWLPNPDNLPQINHKDENPLNNNVDNLEWCDVLYNNNYGRHYERILETRKTSEKWKQGCKHRIETLKTSEKWKQSLKIRGENLSKIVYQYTKDLELVRIWESVTEANRNGFNKGNVASCCRGERKTHKGYRWSYTLL